MRASSLRASWSEGRCAANAWLSLPHPFTAEIMARRGFDSVCVDLQHGLTGLELLPVMLQAVQQTRATALVRAPWNDPSTLMRILDAGAEGIIVPMVNSAQEARAAVDACRYPPQGSRSYGPTRAAEVHGADYARSANGALVLFAMVETRAGLDAVEEIAAVEGITGVYVGPADLSLALGLEPRMDNPEPDHVAAVARILDACRAHGKVAGLHTADPAFAAGAAARGFRLVTVATDASCLRDEAGRRLAAFRQAGGGSSPPGAEPSVT